MNAILEGNRGSIELLPLDPSVVAGMSLRNPDDAYDHYSMRRPSNPSVKDNWHDFARTLGIDPHSLVASRSYLMAGNRVLYLDGFRPDDNVVWDERTESWNPRLDRPDAKNALHAADAIITTDRYANPSVQNADCQMGLAVDPVRGIRAVAHFSWRTIARNLPTALVGAFLTLGSSHEDIRIYVTPGIGDKLANFDLDDTTVPFFARHGRAHLLDPNYGYLLPFDETDKDRYIEQNGQPRSPFGSTVLATSRVIGDDLVAAGLKPENVVVDWTEGIMRPDIHSYRRDGLPDLSKSRHGLSLATLAWASNATP